MNLEINNTLEDFEIGEGLIDLLEDHIRASLEVEGFTDDLTVSLSFVSDDQIRDLNKTYRGIDRVTDVLSFPAWDDYARILGDVIICPQRARDQAEDIGNSLEEELAYLTVHSIFHLLGYDHMTDDDKALMREKEKEALAQVRANEEL